MRLDAGVISVQSKELPTAWRVLFSMTVTRTPSSPTCQIFALLSAYPMSPPLPSMFPSAPSAESAAAGNIQENKKTALKSAENTFFRTIPPLKKQAQGIYCACDLFLFYCFVTAASLAMERLGAGLYSRIGCIFLFSCNRYSAPAPWTFHSNTVTMFL